MKVLPSIWLACLLAGVVPIPLPAHSQEEDPETYFGLLLDEMERAVIAKENARNELRENPTQESYDRLINISEQAYDERRAEKIKWILNNTSAEHISAEDASRAKELSKAWKCQIEYSNAMWKNFGAWRTSDRDWQHSYTATPKGKVLAGDEDIKTLVDGEYALIPFHIIVHWMPKCHHRPPDREAAPLPQGNEYPPGHAQEEPSMSLSTSSFASYAEWRATLCLHSIHLVAKHTMNALSLKVRATQQRPDENVAKLKGPSPPPLSPKRRRR